MRSVLPLLACLAVSAFSQAGGGEDPREIVRRSVQLDQANWIRMADYTWVMRLRERHFDSHDRVTSDHSEAWENFILDGQPFQRTLERDGKPLPAAEKQKQEQKLDKAAARLEGETPEQKQQRAADYQKTRRHERAFLLEIPDAFDFRLEGSEQIDGQDVWVVSGTPKPGYHPKSREGAALLKIHGKMWIAKTGYQWVRVEAQTTQTISFGWFLARLNPGAKLVLEEELVNDEVWLPKREYMTGSGRIGLVKRVAEDAEITWNNYKKFHVESKMTPGGPGGP
ncbi:MAG TPA: hypothetical protein VME43_19290 [Bryobacteraceae bacterium]|nr:hypothetical protein [Bryobacteraceae bacterium]